jgi:hypothetical protein
VDAIPIGQPQTFERLPQIAGWDDKFRFHAPQADTLYPDIEYLLAGSVDVTHLPAVNLKPAERGWTYLLQRCRQRIKVVLRNP